MAVDPPAAVEPPAGLESLDDAPPVKPPVVDPLVVDSVCDVVSDVEPPEPVVSAKATAGVAAIHAPTPKTTASTPTLPM